MLPDRHPPYAAEAEIAVLGSMLVDPEALAKVQPLLPDEAFYREANRRIYRCMLRMASRGMHLDPPLLAEELKRADDLDAAGGLKYIGDLLDAVPSATNAEWYAEQVRDAWQRRRLIEACSEGIRDGYQPGERTVREVLDDAQRRIFAVTAEGAPQKLVKLKSLLYPTFERIEKLSASGELPGVPTGFREIDEYLGGCQSGDLVVIAARPSMGKTALVVGIMLGAAYHGKRVALFSLEMSAEQVTQRCLAHESLVDLSRIARGRLRDDDYPRLAKAAGSLNDLPLYVDDSAAQGVMEIHSKAMRLKAEEGLDLVLVDYLQLMSGHGENRTQEVSAISRGLKALAKELDLPVIALSQLSRAVESRAEKRPVLSDLRESGSIEQDADVVAFLYRPEYYMSREELLQDPSKSGMAELVIAKQRNGPTGTVDLYFRKECARFEDAPVRWGNRPAA